MEDSYEEYRISCAVRNEKPLSKEDWYWRYGLDIELTDIVWNLTDEDAQ